MELDEGSHRPSKAQRWVWSRWLDYWKQVEALKSNHDATLFVCFLGDIMDKGGPLSRSPSYQIITPNEATILEMSRIALEPATSIADYLLFCRGTQVHVGSSGHLEVTLANDLSAEIRDDSPAPWGWYIDIGGVIFDLYHHPVTSGRREHTRGPATSRMAKIIHDDYVGRGMKPPDIAVRAHTHYFAQSGRTATISTQVWQCPSWQLIPAYGYRFGSGEKVEPIGGLYFICNDGHYSGQEILYRPLRSKPWKPSRKKT